MSSLDALSGLNMIFSLQYFITYIFIKKVFKLLLVEKLLSIPPPDGEFPRDGV